MIGVQTYKGRNLTKELQINGKCYKRITEKQKLHLQLKGKNVTNELLKSSNYIYK